MPAALSTAIPELDVLLAYWLDNGALDAEGLERGRRAARAGGERIDRVLNKLGLVSDEAFVAGWAAVSGLPVLAELPEESFEQSDLPLHFLQRAEILPLGQEGDLLRLAICDALDHFSLRAIAAKTGRRVQAFLARPAELRTRLVRLGESSNGEALDGGGLSDDLDRLRDMSSDAPAVRAIANIVDRAVRLSASDVHILPTAAGARVRVRADGVLRDIEAWPRDLSLAVVSRLKVMAGLDIAESRLPQDGRVRIAHHGTELDLRLATIAQLHGEGVVLRILHRARATPDLDSLGMPGHVLAGLNRIIASPSGLVLVTGPTGSGKTTTLYATLQRIARPDRNIVTVEDPVEHAISGAAQVQVDRKIGFDFAVALRSVLRHDPDVVMIGEIRDSETAAIAVRAALTGHLVLATVHTNSALGAIPRLVDMGVEPWLVGSTLRAVLAQRLVRKLCRRCRMSPGSAADRLKVTPRSFEAVGCEACSGSGYQGRICIGEFAMATPRLSELIAKGAHEDDLAAALPDHLTLRDDAMNRVADGTTSHEEVMRVLGEASTAVMS